MQALAPLGNPPVIILPTNAAVNKWILATNAPLLASKWNGTTEGPFKRAVSKMMMPFAVANRRWPKYFTGCTALGLTHDMLSPLDGMGLDLWGGKGPGLKGSRLPVRPSNTSANGRRLAQTTPSGYGALGQGYSTLAGFPFDYTNGGVDAGFTQNPIFSFDSSNATTTGTWGATAACAESFTYVPYYTGSELLNYGASLLSVPSSYNAASFSANPAFANMAYASSNEDVSTFLMTAWNPAAQGGYEINLEANLVLDSDYVTAVTNLANAYDTSNYQSLLESFANSYGAT